jgi:hypothetical protein
LFKLSGRETRWPPGDGLSLNTMSTFATITPSPSIDGVATYAEELGNLCRRLTIV